MIFRRKPAAEPDRDPLEPLGLLSVRFKDENREWVRRSVAEVGAGTDYGSGQFLDPSIEFKRREWRAGLDHELETARDDAARRLDRSGAKLETLRRACDDDTSEIAHAQEALDEARGRVRSTRRPVGSSRRGGAS